MVKQRLTSLDVHALVNDLRHKLNGSKVLNIYDVSRKFYILKLAADSKKISLAIEVGVRVHVTDYTRETAKIPNVFVMKLRKFIRNHRIASVDQLGTDRVIIITMTSNYKLVIELYNKGNVIALDPDNTVIAAWRTTERDIGYSIQIGDSYDLEAPQGPNEDELVLACRETDPNKLTEKVHALVSYWPVQTVREHLELNNVMGAPTLDGIKRTLLSLEDLMHSADGKSGYAITNGSNIYESFTCIEPSMESEMYIKFNSFSELLDHYFTKLEIEKDDKASHVRHDQLESRLDNIKKDQYSRLEKLKLAAKLARRAAEAVEREVDLVDSAIQMMNALVDTGSDWDMIVKEIKEQSMLGHPIASLIMDSSFKDKQFLLSIEMPTETDSTNQDNGEDYKQVDADEDYDEKEEFENIGVWIKYEGSAYWNIKRLHDERKAAEKKYEKTKEASDILISNSEQAVARSENLKQITQKHKIYKSRKTYWFEKFWWFISTDGYLITAGRDATQNEQLYKKYLTKNDLFVHADVHGGSVCIVKNTKEEPVPQTTIDEAGSFAAAMSSGWKSKILVTAYWVHRDQVSKTPVAGEYVKFGGFIVRGKRNPIMVRKLELGITLLFCVANQQDTSRNKDKDKEEINDDQSSDHSEYDLNPQDATEPANLRKTVVRFGSADVVATPKMEMQVNFDSTAQLIEIDRELSVHDKAIHNVDVHEVELNLSGNSVSKRMPESERRNSVDELPPPSQYAKRASPRTLLRHETQETCELGRSISVTSTLEQGTICTGKISRKSFLLNDRGKSLGQHRASVDGGPLPTGYYLNAEIPSTRDLLNKEYFKDNIEDNSGLRGHMNSSTNKAEVPTSISTKKLKKLMKARAKYEDQSDDEREAAYELYGAKDMSLYPKKPEPVKPIDKIIREQDYRKKRVETEVKDREFGSETAGEKEIEAFMTANLAELSTIKTELKEDDEIVGILPMIAPYATVKDRELAIKIIPGGAKKGQAASAIHTFMLRQVHGKWREDAISYLKKLTLDELIRILPATPQVVATGIDKIVKAEKIEKSKLRQAKKTLSSKK